MSGVAVAGCAAAAAWLALPARPRLRVVARPSGRAEAPPLTVRLRLPLAVLSGAAVAVLLAGVAGLLAGVVAGGLAWRALGLVEPPSAARRRERIARDLPGAVDLLVACFAAGAAPSQALSLVAEAVAGPVGEEFGSTHARLALGTDPALVWRDLAAHPQLGPLGRSLGRAHETGASVSLAGERLAEELRARARADVEERARSVSTKAAAPLGACFLPAFVLVGIVPLVASLVGTLGLGR